MPFPSSLPSSVGVMELLDDNIFTKLLLNFNVLTCQTGQRHSSAITERCWPTFLYLSLNHSLEQSRKGRRPISTMSCCFLCLLVTNHISYCWWTSLEKSLSSESIYRWQFITAFSMIMWRSRFRIFLHLASHLQFWG